MHVSIYVEIDLIGSLPKTERSNRYIITLVDYFSKWPEAEPIAGTYREIGGQKDYAVFGHCVILCP